MSDREFLIWPGQPRWRFDREPPGSGAHLKSVPSLVAKFVLDTALLPYRTLRQNYRALRASVEAAQDR